MKSSELMESLSTEYRKLLLEIQDFKHEMNVLVIENYAYKSNNLNADKFFKNVDNIQLLKSRIQELENKAYGIHFAREKLFDLLD